MTTPPRSRTEAEMLAMLRRRFTRLGNGGSGQYAFLTHVRSSAGFAMSTRTLDALVLSLWPSQGLDLYGFEVKCSRSDWLREMKDPGKCAWAVERCDRFYLVAADDSIVREGELPLGWGLLVARGGRLVQSHAALRQVRTQEQRLIDRSWLVCLLRSAGATALPGGCP